VEGKAKMSLDYWWLTFYAWGFWLICVFFIFIGNDAFYGRWYLRRKKAAGDREATEAVGAEDAAPARGRQKDMEGV